MIVKKKNPIYKNQGWEPIHQKDDESNPLKAIYRAKSNRDLTHPNLDISVCEYLLPLVHWFLKIKISLVSHGSPLTFSSKSLFSIAPSHPSSFLDNIRLGRTNLRLPRLGGTTHSLLAYPIWWVGQQVWSGGVWTHMLFMLQLVLHFVCDLKASNLMRLSFHVGDCDLCFQVIFPIGPFDFYSSFEDLKRALTSVGWFLECRKDTHRLSVSAYAHLLTGSQNIQRTSFRILSMILRNVKKS